MKLQMMDKVSSVKDNNSRKTQDNIIRHERIDEHLNL